MIWISDARTHVELPIKPPAWTVPSKSERFDAATIDLIVWTVIWIGGTFLFSEIAYATFGRPAPTHDPRDELLLYSLGIAALCANLYLGIANGAGRSLGKYLNGLTLVVFVGQYPAKPGLARGLVRSALQAGPWMGIAMYNSGAHDKFAGTTVIKAVDESALEDAWKLTRNHSGIPVPPPIAVWKVAVAVLLHLFCAVVYMIMGAL